MPIWNPFMAWIAAWALAGLSKLTKPVKTRGKAWDLMSWRVPRLVHATTTENEHGEGVRTLRGGKWAGRRVGRWAGEWGEDGCQCGTKDRRGCYRSVSQDTVPGLSASLNTRLGGAQGSRCWCLKIWVTFELGVSRCNAWSQGTLSSTISLHWDLGNPLNLPQLAIITFSLPFNTNDEGNLTHLLLLSYYGNINKMWI